MAIHRRRLLRAGLAAGLALSLTTRHPRPALAALVPEMLDPASPLGSDYTVFRSVNKLTAHPHNYQVYEVPNCVVVDPFAFGGKGMACAVHGFSVHRAGVMAADLVGVAPGMGERPLLGRAHYVVMEVPNPAWNSPTNPINGRWLHWEGMVDLFELALSPAQFKEIWYFGMRRGQHDIGNNMIMDFRRVGSEVRLSASSNWKWTSRFAFGEGNTPYRPGDQSVAAVKLLPKPPTGSSFIVDNGLYFADIPRAAGGHTHDLQTTAWLRHDDRVYPAGAPTPPPGINVTPLFPRMPAGADFDPDPAVLAQLTTSARAAYLALNT